MSPDGTTVQHHGHLGQEDASHIFLDLFFWEDASGLSASRRAVAIGLLAGPRSVKVPPHGEGLVAAGHKLGDVLPRVVVIVQ